MSYRNLLTLLDASGVRELGMGAYHDVDDRLCVLGATLPSTLALGRVKNAWSILRIDEYARVCNDAQSGAVVAEMSRAGVTLAEAHAAQRINDRFSDGEWALIVVPFVAARFAHVRAALAKLADAQDGKGAP